MSTKKSSKRQESIVVEYQVCAYIHIDVMQQCINVLWNIPLSNDSFIPPSAIVRTIQTMKCCSSTCSCKINLHGRWTRMLAFDIPARTKVGAAARAPVVRARDRMAGCMLFPFLLKSVPTSMLVHVQLL